MTVKFLVDSFSPDRNIGITDTPEKFNYNYFLLQENSLIPEMHPPTILIPVGRYIAIARANEELTEARMFFIDHRADIEFYMPQFSSFISENVAEGFKVISSEYKTIFSSEMDDVELSASIYPDILY